ncbi:helix-turn-helix domain-containing protein, partial [Variovorax sp. dw_954]
MPKPKSDPLPPVGLRARSKVDKRRRIMEAARAVFIEHGYDAATTREIAQRAEVSTGTVFVYARDKRDLLLQVVNDELDALNARAQPLTGKPGP